MTTVRVALLDRMEDMHVAADLLRDVWGGTEHPVQPALLMAQAHAGNYVSAAWDGDRMVGASMAFLADPERLALHSHITGVVADSAGRGIGRALKDHQARWCRDHGIGEVHWTFDPLVARNAWFNLARLGATVRAYLVDFYGEMPDARNRGQGSDRLLVTWDVAAAGDDPAGDPGPEAVGGADPATATPDDPAGNTGRGAAPADEATGDDRTAGAADDEVAAGGDPVALVAVGADDEPVVVAVPEADVVAVAVPPDIEAMRHTDPDRAVRWRHAVRAAMADRLGADDHDPAWRVAGFTRDGTYLLVRSRPRPEHSPRDQP